MADQHVNHTLLGLAWNSIRMDSRFMCSLRVGAPQNLIVARRT